VECHGNAVMSGLGKVEMSGRCPVRSSLPVDRGVMETGMSQQELKRVGGEFVLKRRLGSEIGHDSTARMATNSAINRSSILNVIRGVENV